jgi:hypothetical protein
MRANDRWAFAGADEALAELSGRSKAAKGEIPGALGPEANARDPRRRRLAAISGTGTPGQTIRNGPANVPPRRAAGGRSADGRCGELTKSRSSLPAGQAKNRKDATDRAQRGEVG